jgi:hypothetical protein
VQSGSNVDHVIWSSCNQRSNAFGDNEIDDQFVLIQQYNYMGRRSLLEVDFASRKGFQLMDPNLPDTAI